MEGLLTHVATSDCFITTPHAALDCGIVTAWWQYQVKVKVTRPHRVSARTSNARGNLRDDYARPPEEASGATVVSRHVQYKTVRD